jgi:hypothetical protein
MNHLMIKSFFLLFSINFLLLGCSEPKLPEDVAANFWKGIQARDIRMLYESVSTETVDEITLDDLLPIREIYLGDTTIEGEKARIVTIVELVIDNESNTTQEINLSTLLLYEGGDWKVDYDTTVSALTVTSGYVEFIADVQELTEGFQEKFNDVIDEYQNTIPQVQREFEKLEEDLKIRIPEMQKKMEEFAKDLEEAMKPPAPPPDTQIEI